MKTVLIYTYNHLWTQLSIERTTVLRLQGREALDAEWLRAAIGTLLKLDLEMSSTPIAKDLTAGAAASDDLGLEFIADGAARVF